ncbi:S-adenosyl-L-methionine-dependent methyltransferase [Marasmius fiardii PR-910]|nr:S-adenosyl-L-methionine-dependent methyltransferase [Marasmius fiardii PR-910]
MAEHFVDITVNDVDRLYHSSPTAPYPFPVDTPEQNRIRKEHELLKFLLGGNFVDPVASALVPIPSGQRVSVDLGTGPGQWPIEMARSFPHVIFHGLDIVPIAPRIDLPNNVHFEIHDINTQTRFLNGSIDVVHARSVSLTVRDYRTIITEAARLLRPGGVFFSGEWRRYPAFDATRYPDRTPQNSAPRLTGFYEQWNQTVFQRLGIRPTVEHEIPQLIAESGLFTAVTTYLAFMPIGDYRPELPMKQAGRGYRDCVKRYMESSRRLFLDNGWTNGNLDTMFSNALQEIRYVEGLGGVYYTVSAIRV